MALAAAGAAQAAGPDTMKVVPRFTVLPAKNPLAVQVGGGLKTWNFSYKYGGSTYNETFVGNPPTGKGVTVPTFIIPLKIVLSSGKTFSATTI